MLIEFGFAPEGACFDCMGISYEERLLYIYLNEIYCKFEEIIKSIFFPQGSCKLTFWFMRDECYS